MSPLPSGPDDHGSEALHDTVEVWVDHRRTGPHPIVRPPVIAVREVRKTYATGVLEVEALRGISFDIEDGEYVAIMGPSGSGKSTLMHILGCLDVPTAGRFSLAGEDVSTMSEEGLAHVRNRRIGFVFQQFNLLASLSAWRNVELPLVYAGVERQVRKARALAALERVGLTDRLEHRPGELSGGQQQRVAVARALVTDPDLILADEPTGNLDSVSAGEVLDLLDELHHGGRTIVLITHDADVARSAERTMRIRDGQVFDAVMVGTPVGTPLGASAVLATALSTETEVP
jgi:putative ABC transport system ATP-binding protein